MEHEWARQSNDNISFILLSAKPQSGPDRTFSAGRFWPLGCMFDTCLKVKFMSCSFG